MIAFADPALSAAPAIAVAGTPPFWTLLRAVEESAENLLLMRLLDRQFTHHPEQGVRRMALHFIARTRAPVNVKRRCSGFCARWACDFYPKPRLSIPDPTAGRYP